MDDSLLVSLRQYRPREGRDSLEDFITEVFAWLLRNVEGVAAKVLETTVMRMRADRRIDVPMCDVTWDTQVAYPGARLDMLAQWAGGAILFEHKVHAALHQEQVLRYQELAQNHFEGQEARVVVISTTFDQHRSEADGCLCWHHIYTALEEYVGQCDNATEQFHIDSFLALLRHEGLHPAAPIDHQAIRYYPIAGKLPNQISQALSPLAGRHWPLEGGYESSMKNYRWGRLGFELVHASGPVKWMPGIFVGVILDGTDHSVQHRHPDQVMLQMILDFSHALHRTYSYLPSYLSLVESLREGAPSTRWSFYHHREEDRSNNYHPIYLETPLLDVLRGTQTIEDQQEALYAAICEALQLLQHDRCLSALTEECRATLEAELLPSD
ncbi:PD-(D/E)XK nuclease family protein [Vreelandella subglaciescola]|jgi:hypothetical protein|uniref:PD-(D/E)XK nuclease superfamily protein n=1 Tax=Vreelandella subglaciescola TaxID=29571 RepID=A0A1M7GA77_9GAMM|nr:PD-(D/E)XK nuclease family protein [Halomonas subglaciescola]SHM13302.1 PD-(D/E)XK nuclease superfamily protein [Halomonas subglaciescola]